MFADDVLRKTAVGEEDSARDNVSVCTYLVCACCKECA